VGCAVRFHSIIRNARIENVGKSQSCMVSRAESAVASMPLHNHGEGGAGAVAALELGR